jgi:RimJ/RimL family protein N-acetyltransferase
MPRVRLRPIQLADAERCYLWESDPDVGRYLGLVQAPLSVEHQRAWIASVLADREHQRRFIILDENDRPIGSCSLRAIDAAESTALLGILIGARVDWGKGYGTAATRALLDHAFGELGLREVRLSCHANNHRAYRCYQKAGFLLSLHEPPRRVFGAHEVRMAITRERWQQVRGEWQG